MSMSQEEIESLMNGLDISENESSKTEEVKDEGENSESMSEEDIEALIAETNSVNDDVQNNDTTSEENVSDESIDELIKDINSDENENNNSNYIQDIDELLNDIEKDNTDEDSINEDSIDNLIDETNKESNDDIDDLLNSLEEDKLNIESTETDESEIDDILENLNSEVSLGAESDYLKELDNLDINNDAQNIEDMEIEKKEESPVKEVNDDNREYSNVVNVDKINIPNQLGEVTSDTEEKATKIFDTLSYVLDDNASLRKTVKDLDIFISSQKKMLETLSSKFPNVKEFSDNLEMVDSLSEVPSKIDKQLSNRDTELFEAMELMQFHDINRQKIERVMGVVVKLSKQLNSIFDDSSGKTETMPISKHLPGDKTSDDIVENDDLDALIAEFGK